MQAMLQLKGLGHEPPTMIPGSIPADFELRYLVSEFQSCLSKVKVNDNRDVDDRLQSL